MGLGEAISVGYWKHRNSSFAVFMFAVEAQCPEMRRGPHEDNEEKHKCHGIHLVGYCSPSKQGGECTGDTAEDNVLGSGIFKIAGIYPCVSKHGSCR